MQEIGGFEQLPVEESQTPALWQASWGAQTTGFAPTQRPVVQVSVCVQPSLSLHAVPSGFGVGSHWPAASLHVPSLHWSPKREQSRAVPPNTPALQASVAVQNSPSSQATPSASRGLQQMPVTELQLPASWGRSAAGQMTGFVPTQVPAWQVSVRVQASPSVQALPFDLVGVEQLPLAGSQTPATWHWSRAAQTTGFTPTQAPAWQVSVRVQASPSVQALPFAVAGLEQVPLAGSQAPATWD